MSTFDLPEPGPTRFADLDQAGLRLRLEHWTDDMRVVLPVGLVRGVVADLDAARRDQAACKEAFTRWGGGLLLVAREAGVAFTTGDKLEDLATRTAFEVRRQRARLVALEVDAAEHRRTRSLLDSVVGWGLR